MPLKLMICLVTFSFLTISSSHATYKQDDAGFAEFKKARLAQFQGFKEQTEKEFEEFVKNWRAAEEQFKSEIVELWPDAKMPDQQSWVEYSDDKQERVVVDYNTDQIEVEIIDREVTDEEAEQIIRQRINQLRNTTVSEAVRSDPVHIIAGVVVVEEPEALQQTLISQEELKDSEEIKPAVEREAGRTRIKITLPAHSTHRRAQEFIEPVSEYAQTYGLPIELVLAVIHTESSFNPMARSHIPAFGLMQIVPQSAGRDVTEFLSGEAYLLSPDELYNSESNIQAGSVYLHLLNSRYFRNVTDDESRLLISIAAYNTGPGNVARALTGTTSLTAASRKANTMGADEIYEHLLVNLPYDETRNYLKRVTERQRNYAAFMETGQ